MLYTIVWYGIWLGKILLLYHSCYTTIPLCIPEYIGHMCCTGTKKTWWNKSVTTCCIEFNDNSLNWNGFLDALALTMIVPLIVQAECSFFRFTAFLALRYIFFVVGFRTRHISIRSWVSKKELNYVLKLSLTCIIL